MQALYFDQFQGPISLRSVDDPSPAPDGVVIAIKATGLCLSDWHGWMGHDSNIVLPHVPGHELAGEIVATGAHVHSFSVGDRVTVPFAGGCGKCGECLSGNQQICDDQFQPGSTAWGSFAEYVAIDYAENNLVHLPESVDFVTAASLGCRFATSFRALVDLGRVRGGEWVAIHGCGGVGLSAVMIASAIGARVIALDIKTESLELARSLGAVATINSHEVSSVVEAVREVSGGGVQLSLDAIGHPQTFHNSIANLRKRGRHVQVGILPPSEKGPSVPVDQIISHELEIYGSHGMQAHRYPEMMAMIENGQLAPERLIQTTISLQDAVTALPQLPHNQAAGIKVISMEQAN